MTPLFILGNRRVKAASLIFALLMGLARIYLVVHYPSDVVAGLIVGVFAGSVAVLIAQKLPRKWYQWDVLEKKKAA
jgi:undecaprenyl-diphosphatase